jgi:hypothetical protein
MSVRETTPIDTNKVTTAPSYGGLMADMAKWGVVFAQPDEGQSEDAEAGGESSDKDDEAAEKKTADKKTGAKPAKSGPSDAEKALQAELKALRQKMDAFGGLTPEQVVELRKTKEEADRLKAEREAEQKKREEDELRKKGDFDALKQRMADEHQKELGAQEGRLKELQSLVDGLQGQVAGMTLRSSFAASRFVSDETLLSPAKAQKVFGDHFEIEEGEVVGYDAPRGAPRRTRLVDGRGNPLAFDEALKRVVEADPDRDTVLRAKQKPGSGQGDAGARAPAHQASDQRGIDRIRSGLAKLRA